MEDLKAPIVFSHGSLREEQIENQNIPSTQTELSNQHIQHQQRILSPPIAG
jgi:hypothetical protein